MNMRERIARAIAAEMTIGGDDKLWAGYLDTADAALAAMAGPTKAMIEAGNLPGWDDCVTIGLSEAVWTVMLAAAGEPE